MLILEQARKKFRTPAKMSSCLLGLTALAISVPFGILSAGLLQSWLVGLVLGASLFTYTILIVRLFKRQPPLIFKRLMAKRETSGPRTINDYSGLRLDYIGAKDPQDSIDGVVHNRAGELQRVLRCSLPQRFSFSAQALLLEMLFADLSVMNNARFQIIFPEAESGWRKEMIIVVSHMIAPGEQLPDLDQEPPLVQMQNILDRLLERLITLGIAPKVMNSVEVRQLISEELGSCGSRTQLNRDWRNVGNLGWEPSFRDITLKPCDRYMQVSERRSYTMALEQLPASGSFQWLASVLADIPAAHLSIFITPWNAGDPLTRMRLNQKIKKHSAGSENKDDSLAAAAAQMSFFFRFDNKDPYQLESEVSTARKYFASLGINSGFLIFRQAQLQNWRSTLPCAQEQGNHKHLIAFMRKVSRQSERA